ncbi:hypothetical protein TWF281_007849 [Arthrobotrys megalospora]
MSRPPSVPRPVLSSGQNLTADRIQTAFRDEYWLELTGNWSETLPLENTLGIMKRIGKGVVDQFEPLIASSNFSSYARQTSTLKDAMFTEFCSRLEHIDIEDERYRSLIFKLLEATDDPAPTSDERNRRWLFNFCMKYVVELRNRKKIRDSQPRSPRGRADYYERPKNREATDSQLDHYP